MVGRTLALLDRTSPAATTPTTATGTSTTTGKSGNTTTTKVAPKAALPSSDQIQAALSALTSADKAAALTVVRDPGDETTQVLQLAYFAGFTATGLSVISDAPAASGAEAVSTIKVVPTQGSNTVYATGQAKWVRVDGTWKLAGWPSLKRQ